MISASLPQLGTMHKPRRAIFPMKKRSTRGVDVGEEAPARDGPLAGLIVEMVRSSRRRRTISATLENGKLIVRVPAGLSPAEERAWAEKLGARILAARRRRDLNDDDSLLARARALNDRFFGGRLTFTDVR